MLLVIIINNMVCKNAAEYTLKLALNERGNRLTSQRLKILNYLRGVTSHPTCDMIYYRLKKQIPSLSLATVYRNMKYLVDHKMVLEIKSPDGKMHFDGNNIAHIHFICKKCQKIYDIWTKKVPQFNNLEPVADIENIDCTIYGTCKKCNK